jgi:hypothetical protein
VTVMSGGDRNSDGAAQPQWHSSNVWMCGEHQKDAVSSGQFLSASRTFIVCDLFFPTKGWSNAITRCSTYGALSNCEFAA